MTPDVPDATPGSVVVLEYGDLTEASTANVGALLAALQKVLVHSPCISLPLRRLRAMY